MNRRELSRYIRRIDDRWPLERAILGGARVADAAGTWAGAVGGVLSHERGPDYVVILVSSLFDGVPWLERVHDAAALWDATEMGGRADVHCYTPVELERKRQALRVVRQTLDSGLDLLSV